MTSSIYSIWLWFGMKMRYLKRYNTDRDTAMANARQALEEAFTPELKQMLVDRYDDKVV